MAESSSEPSAGTELLIKHNKEEPLLTQETSSKELNVTMMTELRAEVPSSNGAADGHLPSKATAEATPTPPESLPSLSSENGTLNTVTTEEDDTLLRHVKTEERPDRGGDGGRRINQVQPVILMIAQHCIHMMIMDL